MESNDNSAVTALKRFFSMETNYLELIEDINFAQTELLQLYQYVLYLPEEKQPSTKNITNLFFILRQLTPLLRPFDSTIE